MGGGLRVAIGWLHDEDLDRGLRDVAVSPALFWLESFALSFAIVVKRRSSSDRAISVSMAAVSDKLYTPLRARALDFLSSDKT